MFSVNVSFGQDPSCLRSFLYKTEEAAKTAFSNAVTIDPWAHMEDDFGHKAYFRIDSVLSVSMEDLDKIGDAQNQRNLVMAKSQCHLQELLNNDPDPALKKVMGQQRQQAQMQRFAGGGMGPGNFPI